MAFTHPIDAQFQAEIDDALALVNDVRIAAEIEPLRQLSPGTRGTHDGCPIALALRCCGVVEVHADFLVTVGHGELTAEERAAYLALSFGTAFRHRYGDRYEVTLPETLRVFGERFSAGFYNHLDQRAGQAAA